MNINTSQNISNIIYLLVEKLIMLFYIPRDI